LTPLLMESIREEDMHSLHIGIAILIVGFATSMVSYFSGYASLYYISFSLIVVSLLYMFDSIRRDLDRVFDLRSTSIYLVLTFITLYVIQRLNLSDSSFITGDASDYYWAGVSSVLKGDDIGFFLPLSSAISAIGFKIFGLGSLSAITVTVHIAVMPIYYFIFRKIGLGAILSLLLISLIQIVPLDIWFSKTTFSEPIWQVLLLMLIYLSYKILDSDRFSWSTYIPFFILISLLPMSRGSAVFIYGAIYFLAIYSFWRYGRLKIALWILLSMLVLTLSIEYTLPIRYRYLVGWQYSRIIPGVNIAQLVTIFYSVTAMFIASIFSIAWIKERFRSLNLHLILVTLAIIMKIVVALLFSIKKGVPFVNLLILNEFGLARGNLGIILVVLIVVGLGYIYYRAAFKDDKLSLILVVAYTLFSIPFVMQNVTIWDQHDMFIYWHRYYFSELFVIHMVALAMVVKLLYMLNSKLRIREMYFISMLSMIVAGVFLYSISIPLHNVVTKEASLPKSSELFSWISDRSKAKSVSVVYDDDIHYGIYNAQQLIYRGLYVTGVDVKSYISMPKERLNRDMKFSPKVLDGDQILCLSTTSCELDLEQFTLVDRFAMSLWWRRSGIDIYRQREHLNIYAYLYDIKHTFSIGRYILFQNSSDIAHKLLGKGWYGIGREAVWSSEDADLLIPNIFEKGSRYQLQLIMNAYDPNKEGKKRVVVSIGDRVIANLTIVDIYPNLYIVDLPPEIIESSRGKSVKVHLKSLDAISPYSVGASKDKRTLGVGLYSLQLNKI